MCRWLLACIMVTTHICCSSSIKHHATAGYDTSRIASRKSACTTLPSSKRTVDRSTSWVIANFTKLFTSSIVKHRWRCSELFSGESRSIWHVRWRYVTRWRLACMWLVTGKFQLHDCLLGQTWTDPRLRSDDGCNFMFARSGWSLFLRKGL